MPVEFDGQRITAIVLDFDKTFYSADKELETKMWDRVRRKLVSKILQEKNIPETTAAVEAWLAMLIKRADEIGWLPAFKELGGGEADFKEVIVQVDLIPHLEYNQELVVLLNQLLQEIPVYIFTGSHSERLFEALPIIIGSLWQDFVYQRALCINNMQKGIKPELAAYQEMVSWSEVEPETTIYVDDQLSEVETAASLGFMTFLIQPESEETPAMVGPHVVINSLAALAAHIQII